MYISKSMATEFDIVFEKLKEMLQKYSSSFTVKPDTDNKYGLYAQVGPATLKIRGKMDSPIMPIAWVEIGKAYVSYHLMGIYMNPKLQAEIPKDLKTRMQGKTCFNFKRVDEKVFNELDELTAKSIEALKKGGFIL